MKLPRWLDPRTNPAGWSAVLGLAYATWQAITAAQAHGPLTWKQAGYIAAGVLWAAVSAYVRSHVTPVADPRDGNGDSLVKISSAIAASHAWTDAERRRAENLRLTHAPGTPSFYPYPGESADAFPPPVRRGGGYTGGAPASEMPPPPTDVPSVSRPAVPPTRPRTKETP
jgi:hypothetical protein